MSNTKAHEEGRERLYTRVTHLGGGVYGCRIFDRERDTWVVEARTTKDHISGAFKSMFRVLDKLGYDSPMAHASRMRDTPYFNDFKLIFNEEHKSKSSCSSQGPSL